MVGLNLPAVPEQTVQARGQAKVDISRWPISAASLRALSELGLSDAKIAHYLRVDTKEIVSLRNSFGIAEGQWRV